MKLFWQKLIAVILTIFGVGFVWAAVTPDEVVIPEHLKLKAPKERILDHKVKEDKVYYIYRSENPSKPLEGEIFRKRTIQTTTQTLGEGKFVTTSYLGQKFYKETEDSDWYDLEYAETTVEAFEKQMKKKDTFGWIRQVFADDTGLQSPAANGDPNANWEGGYTNAYSSDDNRTNAGNNNSGTHDYYEFGFSVTGGATIDGIETQIEGQGEVVTTLYMQVKLSWDTGNTYTATQDTGTYGTTDSTETLGSSSDTWGRTWSSDDFSDVNFRWNGNAFGDSNWPLKVDHIQVKVYYTEVPTGNMFMMF